MMLNDAFKMETRYYYVHAEGGPKILPYCCIPRYTTLYALLLYTTRTADLISLGATS